MHEIKKSLWNGRDIASVVIMWSILNQEICSNRGSFFSLETSLPCLTEDNVKVLSTQFFFIHLQSYWHWITWACYHLIFEKISDMDMCIPKVFSWHLFFILHLFIFVSLTIAEKKRGTWEICIYFFRLYDVFDH